MSSGIQAVARAVAVVSFLGSGELLEWRSVREVADGAGVPVSTCHGILETLESLGWVEKREGKGYRIGSVHLIGLLRNIQQYYAKKLSGLGVTIND